MNRRQAIIELRSDDSAHWLGGEPMLDMRVDGSWQTVVTDSPAGRAYLAERIVAILQEWLKRESE